jgi:chemotaxis protein MotB
MHRTSLPSLMLRAACLAACALAATGCKQNPFQPAGAATTATGQPGIFAQQPPPQVNSQLADLNKRLGQLDGNNSDLHRQLAQAQQENQLLRDQTSLLQKQLGETATKAKEALAARQEVEKQFSMLQASTKRQGGAAITANSSVKQSLSMVNIPGLAVRQDGEVIRIELPADRVFAPTGQVTAEGGRLLDEVAGAIARSYPRQRIVIEGHGDGTMAASGQSHLVAAAQAQAVFQQLTTRNRLPAGQLSILAVGDNHPLAAVATPEGRAKNRRIEIVVYPDAVE